MDALLDNPATFDVDAAVSRILKRQRAFQDRQERRRDFSFWQIAVAGSLTGAALCGGGILVALAIVRALH
jgi:hypothetical protein